MTADNWRICPQCRHNFILDLDKSEERLKKSYGKIESEAFILASQVLQNQKDTMDEKLDETLREDWGLGTDEDGLFVINYKCHCDKCGLNYQYAYHEVLYLSEIKKITF